MPVSITKPTDGGDTGVWAPIADTVLDTLVTFVNGEEAAREAGDAARPTFDQMNAAIAAAIAAAFQAF